MVSVRRLPADMVRQARAGVNEKTPGETFQFRQGLVGEGVYFVTWGVEG
jgi:hypothetical protein